MRCGSLPHRIFLSWALQVFCASIFPLFSSSRLGRDGPEERCRRGAAPLSSGTNAYLVLLYILQTQSWVNWVFHGFCCSARREIFGCFYLPDIWIEARFNIIEVWTWVLNHLMWTWASAHLTGLLNRLHHNGEVAVMMSVCLSNVQRNGASSWSWQCSRGDLALGVIRFEQLCILFILSTWRFRPPYWELLSWILSISYADPMLQAPYSIEAHLSQRRKFLWWIQNMTGGFSSAC